MRFRLARLLIVAGVVVAVGAGVSLLGGPVARVTGLAGAVGVAEAAAQQAPGGAAASGIPRTAAGKPDFSGFWQVLNTANTDIQDHRARSLTEPGGQGVVVGNDIPYQPSALAKKASQFKNRATDDPTLRCHMPGIPRLMYEPFPFQIIQQSALITMLFEYGHNIRYIYTDGSTHPRGPFEWYLGDARGTWDGDTLAVDLTFFNDETWFDHVGNFHSKDMHVVERYSYVDADHVTYEATIEDPGVFTKPWKMSMIFNRRKEKNFRLMEFPCETFEIEQYYPYPELAGDR